MIAQQLNKMVDTMSNMFDVLRSIITKDINNLSVLKDKVIELEKRIKELENK
jgi:polyhydroxyalkanoate synthesis regulator phasin|tara:strand:- start:291 stop:446 length:156 start_codon:yes stop_codon:yes gene_type:complete